MPLKAGDIVTGHISTYRIVNKISEGGMGIVHLAEDQNGNTVVVKEPLLNGQNDDIKLEKIRVEAQALSQINHPNIVRYIDEQDLGNIFYLVVEYIPGRSLLETFMGNPADEDLAIDIILKILEVLDYLHNMGIIHRDLSPDNILLPSLDRPVLIDFGAIKHGFLQMSATIIGKPGWSAPEQLLGAASPQGDIYSAGAILFFLLTGEPPIKYINQVSTGSGMSQIMLTASPKDINPSISEHLSEIVIRAMQPDPALRFQTAREMMEAIRQLAPSVIQTGPRLILGNKVYPLNKPSITIGRAKSQGGTGADIEILEPGPNYYISRGVGSGRYVEVANINGVWHIIDHNTSNHVYIFRGGNWYQIPPEYPVQLFDGDLIALAYDERKGPYITLRYKEY